MKAVAVLACGVAIAWGANTLAERSQQPALVAHAAGDAGTPPRDCPATDTFRVGSAWICGFHPYDMIGQQPPCRVTFHESDRREDREDRWSRQQKIHAFKFRNTNRETCPGKTVS
jgi:hypothetical protein